MKKNYLNTLLIFTFLMVSLLSFGQANPSNTSNSNIEGLLVHPNPVNNGLVYISTLKNLVKHIEIYDVLGKEIHTSSLLGIELNISILKPGIYILRITENSITATRKLVVR
ncbi:hypothetical protein A9Q87_03230 [Flavobacteriales bacterium 34_180_T64]|nr:hypothetical protein A9Q87_03230 [Flavobacteriales bacterium 34_180_T64]